MRQSSFYEAGVRVAIVGGGVSGLYAAWRLAALPDPPRITLYESSIRLGGRIDTAELPVPEPAARADFGAMRFLPSMQMVSSLLNHLNIERHLFPGLTLRQAFLRGVKLDLAGGTNLPYRLAPGESGNPGELLVKILETAVPNALQLTAQQWREAVANAQFKGRELWKWAVENVAEECISNEAYEYLSDISGLDSALLTSNAALGVRCLAALLPDYAAQQVFSPVNGFSSLIDSLRVRLEAHPSCTVRTQRRLLALRRIGRHVKLEFATPDAPPDRVAEEVFADRVILAMPRRALELIDLSGLFPDRDCNGFAQLMNRLGDVHGIPAFKLGIAYRQPWWQQYTDTQQTAQGWQNGYAVTDLPLRQVFFGLGSGGTEAGNQRVLLATYADTRAAQYWRAQADVSATALLEGKQNEIHLAGPGNLRNAVERQLTALLQVNAPLPEPLAVGFMDWSADPFGGGWHEWNPGVNVTAAIPYMRHPVADTPVYICGEAYSWFQSWIEGALMSAERMLQDHFDLPWPAEWLPRDYDLGP